MAKRTFAATAPEKILSADIFGPAAKARSASCVRSPNSAKNVVVKELRMTALAAIFGAGNWNWLVSHSSLATSIFASNRLASIIAFVPKRRNAIPETI